MTTKVRATATAASAAKELESLYHEFLDAFYGEDNRRKSERLAKRLEAALATRPDFQESIRSEEIRSLLAELRGNFQAAIHSREAEIRKIFELHSQAVNTPDWDYVFSLYDFSDISDRLDLLGLLYDQQGDLDRAIAVLEESKHFCKAHDIPFDGQEILDELQENRAARERRKSVKQVSRNGKKRSPVKNRPTSSRR